MANVRRVLFGVVKRKSVIDVLLAEIADEVTNEEYAVKAAEYQQMTSEQLAVEWEKLSMPEGYSLWASTKPMWPAQGTKYCQGCLICGSRLGYSDDGIMHVLEKHSDFLTKCEIDDKDIREYIFDIRASTGFESPVPTKNSKLEIICPLAMS